MDFISKLLFSDFTELSYLIYIILFKFIVFEKVMHIILFQKFYMQIDHHTTRISLHQYSLRMHFFLFDKSIKLVIEAKLCL